MRRGRNRGREEVAEDVDGAAELVGLVAAACAEFDAADEFDAAAAGFLSGVFDSGEGVVIGECERFEAEPGGEPDEFDRGIGAVAEGGMGVQVDQ